MNTEKRTTPSSEFKAILALAAAGALAGLIVLGTLLKTSGWHGWAHTVMVYALIQGLAGVVPAWRGHAWAGALWISTGLGYFFAFMLGYAHDPVTLGTFYPLALWAATPWCV
ncbi:hypothetical protein D6833_07860, partial [Candidatus Parcubacteria bacterium]